MEIVLLGIGRTNMSFVEEGIREYTLRLSRYIPFRCEWLRDIKGGGQMPEKRQKELEGEMLLGKIQTSDMVVLLDERGNEFTSRGFSDWLSRQMASGRKRLLFIIGGPYGFSQKVYARADSKISLSRMTFNHEMVRIFFIEQLYRAQTIMRGEPYHHE